MPKPKPQRLNHELIRVWRPCYRPFMMGGDVHAPVAALLPAVGPYKLGKGFMGYIVRKSDGTFAIVEKTSGGVVGDTLGQVQADIKKGDIKVMRKQVAEAIKRGKEATLVDADVFWSIR